MAQKLNNQIGRRKTASARVILQGATKVEKVEAEIVEGEQTETKAQIVVNGMTLEQYFTVPSQQDQVLAPLVLADRVGTYAVRINVSGGGKAGQAGAARLGISRAIQAQEPELRAILKTAGYLTRDPRSVERKKAGKHKARKSTQFSKR